MNVTTKASFEWVQRAYFSHQRVLASQIDRLAEKLDVFLFSLLNTELIDTAHYLNTLHYNPQNPQRLS
jgi:hypothetical protein